MPVNTILFDLDGTLLPMDQDLFVSTYFKKLAAALAPHGYNPQKLISDIWTATKAMLKNDGKRRNEEAFWSIFTEMYGDKAIKDKELFDKFYCEDFQSLSSICGCNPEAAQVISKLKSSGFRLVLATNPLFPAFAVESRLRWAGVSHTDFEYYTSYENCSYSKPNPDYYREILSKLDLKSEQCLMVGNDADEDMIAASLGMKAFLLTDCLINKSDADINQYPHGSFSNLMQYIENVNK